MKFSTEVEVIEVVKTSDGMGGFTKVDTVTGYLQVHMSPVKVELMLKQYGLTTGSAFRFVTKDSVPDAIHYFRLEGNKYKMVELLQYDRFNVILVEVVK